MLTNKIKCYYFDNVFVASGHYHTPNYVAFPNAHLFKGEYLHSHDYRSSEIFTGDVSNVTFKRCISSCSILQIVSGKSVLIIGGGPSALDLSNHVSRSAKQVTLSHHVDGISNSIFYENVDTKPDVTEFDEYGVYFKDGSYSKIDVVLYCTGYKYAFPFLSVSSGIYVEDNHVQMLYKQCINIRNPTMALIGLPFYVCAAQMMDLQARFVLSYLIGTNKLPPVETMQEDTIQYFKMLWERGYKRRQAHMLGETQVSYINLFILYYEFYLYITYLIIVYLVVYLLIKFCCLI